MKVAAVSMSETAKLYKPNQLFWKLRKLSLIDLFCILCTEIYLVPWGINNINILILIRIIAIIIIPMKVITIVTIPL